MLVFMLLSALRTPSMIVTQSMSDLAFLCAYLWKFFQRTYVICRLEYKGNDKSILSANATDPTPTFVPNMTSSAGSVVSQCPSTPLLFAFK